MNPQLQATLTRILDYARKGWLGANDEADGPVYYDAEEHKYCAIGCLLPSDTINRLIRDDRNSACAVQDLVDIGYFDPEQHGLTSHQARILQTWHDDCYDPTPLGPLLYPRRVGPNDFIALLEHLLEGHPTRVAYSPTGRQTDQTPAAAEFNQ